MPAAETGVTTLFRGVMDSRAQSKETRDAACLVGVAVDWLEFV